MMMMVIIIRKTLGLLIETYESAEDNCREKELFVEIRIVDEYLHRRNAYCVSLFIKEEYE